MGKLIDGDDGLPAEEVDVWAKEKHDYPPDLQDAAVQTVLQQAEALSSGWSVARPGSGGGNG